MTVQRVVEHSDMLAQTLSPVVHKLLSVGILTFRPSVQPPEMGGGFEGIYAG
jgi:hypothetical protein